MKICILGAPGTGKTHLARQIVHHTGMDLLETDDLIEGNSWDEQPQKALEWLALHPDHVIEGMGASRLLSKGYRPDVVFLCMVRHEPPQKSWRGLESRLDRAIREYGGKVVRLDY